MRNYLPTDPKKSMFNAIVFDLIADTFPANGKFSDEQRAIYNITLEANRAVQRAMKPGVEWTDMHRLAERVICEGLIKVRVRVCLYLRARVGVRACSCLRLFA